MFVQNEFDDHLDGLKRILLGGMIGTSVNAIFVAFNILQERYHKYWLFSDEDSIKIDDLDRGRIEIKI